MLSFFLAGPPFLPSPQCIPGRREKKSEREKRKGEKRSLRARVLATLKPNCFSSPSKLATKLSRFSSSLFFHFLFCQMPQISATAASDLFFKIILCIYVCIACGCHLVYKLERGQAWSGSAAGSPRSTLCCRKHFTLSTPNSHYHFPTLCSSRESWPGSPWRDPGEDFCPALPWLSATVLSQTRPPPDFRPV